MASLRNVNNSEKAKLQRELQFYTNLVSNHEKLQARKPSNVKQSALTKPYENPVQLGNSSRSYKSATTASVFPQKCIASNENVYKRSVIQSKFKSSLSTPSLFPKRSVIKPSLTKINNFHSAMAHRKIYNNPQRTVLHNPQQTVLHNPKPLIMKAAVSSRSVLPPRNTLKSTNITIPKPSITVTTQSNDLQKALSEAKKVFMKVGSKKQIDDLNALTKQLEKQNKNISVRTCSVKSSNILDNAKSNDIRSSSNSLNNKNTHCNNMSELDGLKCKVANIAKMLSLTPTNLNKKISNKTSSSLPIFNSKNTLDSSSLTTINAEAPIMSSLMKDKNVLSDKLSLTMNQIFGTEKGTVTKLVKSLKSIQSSCASTPVTKKDNLHKLRDIKKSLAALQAANVKNAQNKSIQRNKTVCSPKGSSQITKQPANGLLKSPKPLPANCNLTPVTKRLRLQKLSTIKQGNLTKLITSKYKIVNKNPSTCVIRSSQNKYFKRRPAAAQNSFNKGFQNVYKAPCVIKTLNSNYKVVNLVKTPKKFNNSLLKASTPKSLIKHTLKKRKLETCRSTQKPKLIFKHTKVNYLVKSNSKSFSKSYLNRKSNTHNVNSKYKVVNRPGSSKKLSKSPKFKQDVVCRTKSGVDIDLLLELAAEKELTEKESGVKTLRKRDVLLKRVYKTKNAIVNKNVCSSTGTKVAKMIKAKYSLNKRNTWQKQSFSKRFISFKHYKDHSLGASFRRSPNKKQFYNPRIKRNHFASQVQNRKHMTKFSRNHKGSFHYNKTHQKSFNRNDFLKSKVKYTPVSKVLASRVLHQSINRVLTASVKKKLSKVNTYCMFYNRFGRCNKGLKCTYVHDPSKIAVCTRFLRGTCKNQKCLFSHEISPGKMAICSFFLLGSCTKSDCPYRHETLSADAELCKAFVQGYCPDGKQCKKAHVLVCPQYIQGFCDKGDACAFPHPPRKEKKILPKPMEKSETPAEEEDFMDKVSRYFQPANEQSVEINETAVVPKRQKLPEQPSFIAL